MLLESEPVLLTHSVPTRLRSTDDAGRRGAGRFLSILPVPSRMAGSTERDDVPRRVVRAIAVEMVNPKEACAVALAAPHFPPRLALRPGTQRPEGRIVLHLGPPHAELVAELPPQEGRAILQLRPIPLPLK